MTDGLATLIEAIREMPQAVVIAVPPTVGIDVLARFAREVATRRGMRYSDAVHAHHSSPAVQIFRDERRDCLFIAELLPREDVAKDFAEDYADRPDVDPRFPAQARALSYVSVTFAELDTVRDFVSRLFRWLGTQSIEGWMDTDFGEVIAADEVVRRLDENPSWDWRLTR